MNLFERNLARLAKGQPDQAARIEGAPTPLEAAIHTTRTGEPTVVLHGVSLHSRIDPGTEAERLARALKAQAEPWWKPAVFGFGLGFHVRALANLFSGLVVIEPDPGMVRLALTVLDFGEVLERVVLLVGRPPYAAGANVLWGHPPSVRLFPEDYAWWARRLARVGPAGRAGPLETVGELTARCSEVEGLVDLTATLDAREPAALSELVRMVRTGRGPLTKAEVFTLLIHELA